MKTPKRLIILRRNYRASRNKKVSTDKLERRKYCPFCRGHKVHKETKV